MLDTGYWILDYAVEFSVFIQNPVSVAIEK